MKDFVQFIYLFLLSIAHGLYEDQIGRFDWKQEYIGMATHASVETVLSNGRFLIIGTAENVIASISLKSGSLMWRQVLEKSPYKKLSHLKLSHLSITSDHQVLSVQGNLIRTWDPSAGTLTSEVQCMHAPNKSAINSFVLYADGILGTVESLPDNYLVISSYATKTGKLISTKEEKVEWMNSDTKCTTSKEFFICYSENNSTIRYISIQDHVLREENLDVKTLQASSVFYLGEISGSSKQSFIIMRNKNIGTVYKITKASVSLVTTVDPDTQSLTLSEVDNEIMLYLCKGNKLYASDLNSGENLKQLDCELEKDVNKEHSVLLFWVFGFPRKESGYTTRILVTGGDHSLTLYSSSGKPLWVREEALASIIKVEMIDLPMSPSDVAVEKEFEGAGGIMAMFLQRLNMQAIQLNKFLFNTLGLGGFDSLARKMDMTRDEFNLHRIIVAVTASGKTFGIDNKDGKILWQISLPHLAPFQGVGRNGHEMLLLYVQRNTKHYPFQPLCLLVGKNKIDGKGILVSFNPISGDLLSVENLSKSILQATLMHHVNNEFIHPVLLLLEGASDLLVYPENATDFVSKFRDQFYMFTSDAAEGILTGYSLRPSTTEALKVERTWVVHIPRQQQLITHVVGKSSFEKVHSQGRVMGDRGVLYKYLNPNLIAVVAEGTDPVHKYFINVYLLDGITGEIVYSATHKRMRGPVHIVHSENWVVYSMYNDKARRHEIASIELYESKYQSNSTAFSSLSSISDPVVQVQAFIFPSSINSMCDTVTEKGITNKHLLIGLPSGGVLELPRAYLDPRRPLVPTAEHRDEGLLPYIPEIPIHSEALINYYQVLEGIKGIFTSPSGLESTSLVLVYGLDLFYTRVSPSKTFDVLKDDFDHYFICVVLGGLCLASYITKMLAGRKALKQAWK